MDTSTSIVGAINEFLYSYQFLTGFFLGMFGTLFALKFKEGRPIFGRKQETSS